MHAPEFNSSGYAGKLDMNNSENPKDKASNSSYRKRRRLYENDATAAAQTANSRPGASSHQEGDQRGVAYQESVSSRDIDDLIKRYCYWSFSISLIPVPIVDLAAMVTIQVKMIQEISKLHKIPLSDEKAKKTVAVLIANVSSSSFMGLAKLAPGIGYLVVTIPLATINVTNTYAVGKIFAHHFESGHTIDSLGSGRQKAFLQSTLADGKAFARRTKKEFLDRFKNKP